MSIDRDCLAVFIATTRRSMRAWEDTTEPCPYPTPAENAAFLAECIADYLEAQYDIAPKGKANGQAPRDRPSTGLSRGRNGKPRNSLKEEEPRPAPQMPKGAETTTRG